MTRVIKNSKGRVIARVRVKPHIRTRPTKRWAIFRRR